MSLTTVRDALSTPKDSAAQWGDWVLCKDNWTLVHQREHYEIDLESCDTSAEMLDWIFQIQGKGWATPQALSTLLHAFSDIFDPQKNLCSGGGRKRINAPAYLRKRYGGPKPKTPAKAKPTPVQLDAQEFLDALLVYPVGCEFSLWNLQGDMGIRLSTLRRGKYPAEIDFAKELALAKAYGWLKEQPEDKKSARSHQDGNPRIRYGAMFVRTAGDKVVKAQRERFIGELVSAQSNHVTLASKS